MKKILLLIINICLVFGLVGIGTQAYFSDAKTSSINTFTAGVWQYTITATAGDGGSIEPSGNVIVNEGKNQTFTITPDEGYSIDDVEVDGKSVINDITIDAETGIGIYEFINVSNNHTINATFTEEPAETEELPLTYIIIATADDGGSIDPSGDVIVNKGNNQTFTITAGEGYTINDVEVDGESVGALESYTFENVTGSHNIYAIFTIENNEAGDLDNDSNLDSTDENDSEENG